MISKIWISDKLFTKSGNLNNRVCIDSWWVNRNYSRELEFVKQQTSFLPENSSLTERLYCIYYNLKQKRVCKMCDKYTSFKNFKTGYLPTCSIQCATKDPDRSAKIVANTNQQSKQETMKQTNLKKYGVERTSKMFAYKTKITKQERYGNPNYNNPEKISQTVRERYGVSWSSQIPSKIEKTIETRTAKIPLLRDKEWLQTQNKTKSFFEIGEELGVSEFSVGYWFKKHGICAVNKGNNYITKPQYEIQQYIHSLGFDYESNSLVIKPKHLDIFIPSKSLGIELNGLFWHSDYYIESYKPNKHLTKLQRCIEKDIKCLQFWSHEWIEKKDICKSIISNQLGVNTKIYARNTVVKPISNEVYSSFLNENHLHGAAAASIRYGLFYGDELVQVIGFVKSRFTKKYDYEISRSATKLFTNVVGGFSKLMKHAPSGVIVSYCNRMLYDGKGYKAAGFEFQHFTPPNYFYFNPIDESLHSRIQFQKYKLKDKLDVFDPSLTEVMNMRNNGWYRVHDCGNSVWLYKGK